VRARGPSSWIAARRRWAWVRRLLAVAVACVVLAVLYVVIGLIPVNRGFMPTPGGVEVALVSSAVHADVIVPIVPLGRRLGRPWFFLEHACVVRPAAGHRRQCLAVALGHLHARDAYAA